MDPVVEDLLRAIELRDWERVRLLLHPYLRWTDSSGTTVLGRTKVMSRIMDAPVVGRHRSYELRDEQIYSWQADP